MLLLARRLWKPASDEDAQRIFRESVELHRGYLRPLRDAALEKYFLDQR